MDRIIAANLIEYLARVRHCDKYFTCVTSLNVLNNYEIHSSAGLKKTVNSYYFNYTWDSLLLSYLHPEIFVDP